MRTRVGRFLWMRFTPTFIEFYVFLCTYAFHPHFDFYVCVLPKLLFLHMYAFRQNFYFYVCVSPKLLFLCMRFTKTFISMYAFLPNFYFDVFLWMYAISPNFYFYVHTYVYDSPKLLFLCMYAFRPNFYFSSRFIFQPLFLLTHPRAVPEINWKGCKEWRLPSGPIALFSRDNIGILD
jgi:hypothetical protein